MKLYPHQQEAVDFLLAKKRCILADAPRVGKTLPTAVATSHNLPALVVCPAVAKNVWLKAFNQIGVKATVISGKKEAAAAVADGVLIVNYDILQNLGPLAFQTLVLDESHRIKSPTAKRTKVAMKMMKATPNVYCLSGTPIPNRPIEIWTVLHGLGIFKGSWLNFAYQYAKAWQSPWGLDVSGASNIPELKAKMKPWVLRRKRADVFTGYQKPVISLIELDLPVDRREKKFDADALAELPNAIMSFEGLAEIMREGGLNKLPQAIDFIEGKLEEDHDEPLVVFCWHKEVADILLDKLQPYDAVKVTGDTAPTKRQQAIDDFQAGHARVIIGNIATLGEGVDLSRSSTVIFVESTWATSALEQASARVENITKLGSAPSIYILTTRNSLDHAVLSRVLKKMGVIDQIL